MMSEVNPKWLGANVNDFTVILYAEQPQNQTCISQYSRCRSTDQNVRYLKNKCENVAKSHPSSNTEHDMENMHVHSQKPNVEI